MAVRILACLLCFAMCGGALDSLPDPPAVKPKSSQLPGIAPIHHVSAAAENRLFERLALGVQLQADLVSNVQSFEGERCSEPLIRYATDISPPSTL
jgi:hypothetical protein